MDQIGPSLKTLSITLILSLFSYSALGFVENITHGYQSCLACHVSPSGGGLLSDYGRSLSKELMSTWGWQGSEEPLFGAVKNKEWFKVGGDVRAIQTYFDNKETRQGRQFTMQKNIELGFNFDQLWFVGTLGTKQGPKGTTDRDTFLSERYFVMWSMTDEIRLRLGKFRLQFGLNDPNHTRVTKQPLGFGLNSESTILEISKLTEKSEIFISADLGKIDIPRNQSQEKSISTQLTQYISTDSKLSLSYLLGDSNERRRSLMGVSGIFSITEHQFIKFETDYQISHLSNNPQKENELIAAQIIWGYRIHKGILPYITLEHLNQNLKSNQDQLSSAGLGLQWFPIPHVEFQLEVKSQYNQSSNIKQSESGWFLTHFYL